MGNNYLNPEKHLQFHLKVTGERQFIQMQVTMGRFQSWLQDLIFAGGSVRRDLENSDIETIKDIPMKPIDKDDEDSDRRMVILAIHKMPKDVNAKLDRPFEKFELYDVSKSPSVQPKKSSETVVQNWV